MAAHADSFDSDAKAAIVAAPSVDDVADAAARMRDLPGRMLAEGATSERVTATLTALNDLIVGRMLALTGADAALRAARGCWIGLGSQGRSEQTLATDQ